MTQRSFNPLLPSAPIPLPFGGDYRTLSVVYDQDRVLAYGERMQHLVGDVLTDLQDLARARDAAQIRLDQAREGTVVQTPEELLDQINSLNTRARAREREFHLRVIADTVLHVGVAADGEMTWPFADTPPDPGRAETWDAWSPAVIAWLASVEAHRQVREQLNSPKSNGR